MWASLVPSSWGMRKDPCVRLHVGFLGWLVFKGFGFVPPVGCLVSALLAFFCVCVCCCQIVILILGQVASFCSTPYWSCKRSSINTLFTVKLLGLII